MSQSAAPVLEEAVEELKALPEDKIASALDYIRYLRSEAGTDDHDTEDVNVDVKQALREVALHRQGQLELSTFDELLHGLRGSRLQDPDPE